MYQGMVILENPGEEPEIAHYEPSYESSFRHDTEKGTFVDGRKIIDYKWLDQPVSEDNIGKIATRFFIESRRKSDDK